MFNFFSFRKKQENKENQLSPLIISKLDRIIELLEKQQLENPQNNQKGNNLHFDHVQVDHLENIVFRLDNIEIDELSGKLIIGNNITGSEELAKSLIQKTDKEKAKKEAMSETESSDEAQMMKTDKGYRFRNNI
ncbi:hypothetical protein [Bacillus xiapuensis]|uniref:Uncharacterized protein n=1 Tax=Bacillus xiapuensis TaxID=2014075 RepID=A0ABU6NGR1_9BACI|nr:hypothetical protein [Bacillus xiapuensis]